MSRTNHTLSEPGKDWEGFQPTGYFLDGKRTWALPLNVVRSVEGKRERVPITLGEAFLSLGDEHLEEIESLVDLKVRTASGEHLFSGPGGFNLQLLEVLLRLRKGGIDGFAATWCWYDSDSVTDDPHDSYAFFVVFNDKIVAEFAFSDYHGSGFDPSIFTMNENSPHVWRREPDRHEANVRRWYRRFYTETPTGQMMVLRPDEPPLFHYPEGRWSTQAAFAAFHGNLLVIRRVLWWIVIIVAIIAIKLLWR